MTLAVVMIILGGTIIIDEVETSFHKSLVESLILLFNDKRINKNNANLIFSTHYIETLDVFNRKDNIFVVKKDVNISVNNLHTDYEFRNDALKSNLFNNNMFETLIDYDRLMDLKKVLINDISITV